MRWVTQIAAAPISRLVSLLTAEKNRMHKVLFDAGIRLGVVVSDIHGQSARAMIKGILDGQAPHEVLNLASKDMHQAMSALICFG